MAMRTLTGVLLVITALIVSVRAEAQPQPHDPAAAPKPWSIGVSDDEQRVALALYDEGNVEFQAARFAQALAKYSEALKHWDHPAIHFNMTVCLINLDQPIEAKLHLERALQHGEEPLGPDMYAQGLTHRHSLDGQIARVKITCREPETTVTLDGGFLFTAPGEVERLVLPGRHQIVGTKPGYATASDTIELQPARVTQYEVHLVALKAPTKLVRPWVPWKPWAVLGGGVATLGFGALAYVAARHRFDDYDNGVASRCPSGCDAAMVAAMPDLGEMKHGGYVARDFAIVLFVAGGALVTTGIVGLVLNQPHAVLERRAVTPAIVPTTGGATLFLDAQW
jgi:hypothetical protein